MRLGEDFKACSARGIFGDVQDGKGYEAIKLDCGHGVRASFDRVRANRLKGAGAASCRYAGTANDFRKRPRTAPSSRTTGSDSFAQVRSAPRD
jgi:hypothetical protein